MGNAISLDGVRGLAARQGGRVSVAQLVELGISYNTVRRWSLRGYLIPVLPRVYAVGHTARHRESALWAALLYAGPGSALSHATAAAWLGLIDQAPSAIEVSTPRRVRSVTGLRVFGQREVGCAIEHGLPVTTVVRTLLDLAAVADPRLVRRALAQLDYRRQLDREALTSACRRGVPGSAVLRLALDTYHPRLAHANGRLEEDFLEWCVTTGLPVPKLNVWVHGVLVDAHWPRANLVVELDGYANHASRAQLRRDHANDLLLRRHGLTVLRYDWTLVRDRRADVRREILSHIAASSARISPQGRLQR